MNVAQRYDANQNASSKQDDPRGRAEEYSWVQLFRAERRPLTPSSNRIARQVRAAQSQMTIADIRTPYRRNGEHDNRAGQRKPLQTSIPPFRKSAVRRLFVQRKQSWRVDRHRSKEKWRRSLGDLRRHDRQFRGPGPSVEFTRRKRLRSAGALQEGQQGQRNR